MTKEKKLERIYEEIANKELSFGCRYIIVYEDGYSKEDVNSIKGPPNEIFYNNGNGKVEGHIDKIIGHPVMIGDVFDWIGKNTECCDDIYKTFAKVLWGLDEYGTGMWSKTRLPIEDQSDESIDFIYSLLDD